MIKTEFGVIGLGVMGKNLALNLLDKGSSVSVYNRAINGEESFLPNFLKEVPVGSTTKGFTDLNAFVQSLNRPRKVLLMVKAGKVVDYVLDDLLPLLDDGDIVIDGGNSHFFDTDKREYRCKKNGIYYVGMGVSGGETGARFGPSLMVGGDEKVYHVIGPILEQIAAKDDFGTVCCAHIGQGGAGHFVKMLHNGIEYAEMQLLAEIFHLLKENYSKIEIHDILSDWQVNDHSSFLLDATLKILKHKTGNLATLDLILDVAGSKGTGSWSAQTALDMGICASMINSAVFARIHSGNKSQRVENSLKINREEEGVSIDLAELERAYHFARLINHHQGFEVIRHASEYYNWQVKLSDLARIWTNGCILRSSLMKEFVENFKEYDSILENPKYVKLIDQNFYSITQVLHKGLKLHIPLPCFQSAYNYWLTITTETLPANLIQALRDFFGAHTYQRIDQPKDLSFHTNWKKNSD